jgi:o-succinylbenzoate---CoA ligase
MISNEEHWLKQQALLIPRRTALIYQGRKLTYKNLYNECLQYSGYFLRLGIKRKEHVGILYSHDATFFKVVNALWFIGAVPVLLNIRETTAEINLKLKQADIKFLLVDKSLKQFDSAQFRTKTILGGKNIPAPVINKNITKPFAFKADNPALILFTSGSSGKPKAVVHTFNSIFHSVKTTALFTGVNSKDLWLVSLPLYHIGGFMILCRALITGCAAAFPRSLSYEYFTEALTKYKPSFISIVPTTLFKLLNGNIKPNKNLKYTFLGGGPSEAQLSVEAQKRGWQIVKVYGSSETCSMVTALHPGYLPAKAESSGKPLNRNKIKIRYTGSKNSTGEILVRIDSLFKYYYTPGKKTVKNKKGGWFCTGDYGSLDRQGFLFVDTRKEEMIISGGENISTKEIESALKSINNIKDVYVFPLKDKKWGQIVCAAVTGKKISEDEIKDYLIEKISGYKIPKRIYFLNAIPRNEMGKVVREKLFKKISLD